MTTAPSCPTCRAPLALTHQGDFDAWACPQGHGLAATMSEGYVLLQEDELQELWQEAKAAPAGARPCPMCAVPMKSVDLGFDTDEVPEGEDGDGADTGAVPLDMCTIDQVIWFDAGELELLPGDLPDPEPTAEELARVEEIRQGFGEGIEAALEGRDDGEFTERFYNRIAKHPSALKVLDRTGRAVTSY